jgi:cell division protein FtsA
VLQARAEEMIELVATRLEESGYAEHLPAGVVLTGGCSQLPGFADLGRRVLGMPVRVGAPLPNLPLTGLSRSLTTPAYSTSLGLLLWGLKADPREPQRRYEADHGGDGPTARAWPGQAFQWLKHLLPDRN